MNSIRSGDNTSHIFISYSTVDGKWLDRLLDNLRPLVREGSVRVFSNKNIQVGQDWRGEIQAALGSATVAVLLVSDNFLASDFIMRHELPPLLAAAEERGTIVMPVIVGHSPYEDMPELARFQAANSPDRPLSSMRPSEWSRVLVNLARTIAEISRGS
jgi:hypothetical protein